MSLSTPKRWFTGQELVERWRLNPAQLSLCMQVGLQPYLLREDESFPLLVIDPVGIRDEERSLALLQLLSLGGRQRANNPPDNFTGNRVQPVIAPEFHPMHFRVFDSDEVDSHAVIAEHMECRFISDDIYEFERAYGLGAESIPPKQNDEMCGEGTLREPPMLTRVSSQGEGGPKAAASANNPEDEGTTGSSFDSEYARKLTERWVLDGDPARPRLKISELSHKLAFDAFWGYGNLDQVAMIIQNSGGSANLFPSWLQPRPKQVDLVHVWCAKMGLRLYREGELEPFEWGLDGKPYRDHWQELDDCLISKEDLRAFLTEQKLPLPEFWFPTKNIPEGVSSRQKKQRQSTRDKAALQTWARSTYENGAWPPPKEIAEIARRNPQWSMYSERQIVERWLRPIHPNYTKGKPGRKRKTSNQK